MYMYFFLVRLAALLGHKKAKKLVAGQKRALDELKTLGGSPVVWFHAASVGEFEQARPVIERLRQEQPDRRILLTFFSPSGYELRKNYDLVDKVVYLPFATKRNAERFLKTVNIQLAIFIKYEFWPAYLHALKRHHVPTYLISAIFRPGQLFFLPWGKPYLRLLTCFEHIFVQDDASRQLLNKHGICNVDVAGDTRFDRVSEVRGHAKDLPIVEGFTAGAERVLVAGSTWCPDEQLLARYIAERPNTKLVLVPHEIDAEHLHHIFQFFEGRYVRYSEATPMSLDKCRVLLVDTIGVLSSIYRYGHVAYIGGGFGEGIHNTLEAAVYGMPVVFGPKWKKFREARGLLQSGAARTVRNYTELTNALDEAFLRRHEMGQKAAEYVQSECGATSRIFHAIFNR